jgi:hypothetical protein
MNSNSGNITDEILKEQHQLLVWACTMALQTLNISRVLQLAVFNDEQQQFLFSHIDAACAGHILILSAKLFDKTSDSVTVPRLLESIKTMIPHRQYIDLQGRLENLSQTNGALLAAIKRARDHGVAHIGVEFRIPTLADYKISGRQLGQFLTAVYGILLALPFKIELPKLLDLAETFRGLGFPIDINNPNIELDRERLV